MLRLYFSRRKIDIIKIDGCLGVLFSGFVHISHCEHFYAEKKTNIFHWLIKNIDLNVRFTIEIDSNEELWSEYGAGAFFSWRLIWLRWSGLKIDSYLLWAIRSPTDSRIKCDKNKDKATEREWSSISVQCAQRPVTMMFICVGQFLWFSLDVPSERLNINYACWILVSVASKPRSPTNRCESNYTKLHHSRWKKTAHSKDRI